MRRRPCASGLSDVGGAGRVPRRHFVVSMLCAVGSAAVALTPAAQPLTRPSDPFERLGSAQRHLIAPLLAPAGAAASGTSAAAYLALPVSFRQAFETLTGALEATLLSDAENGETLGVAIDLVESLDSLDGQPAVAGGARPSVAVQLIPGAVDRLRRSSEFLRLPEGSVPQGFEMGYRRAEGTPVLVLVGADRRSALLTTE